MFKINDNELFEITKLAVDFVKLFAVGDEVSLIHAGSATGNFGLYRNRLEADLYGMVDVVYIYHITDTLRLVTNVESRKIWAQRILECQDDLGWFSKKNIRGHSQEHATAYAIAALRLLEIEPEERYLIKIKPLIGIRQIFKSEENFVKWISKLGFKLTIKDPVGHLGWHYIWRSSHIGGGVAAAVGMTRELHREWWGEDNVDKWFDWYFGWLDNNVYPKTGYWQQAFWNLFTKVPTLIDMAGAVHFYWIYDKYHRKYPFPEKVIESTLKVQPETGIYKKYPMCIDLDGNYCLVRSYLQLGETVKVKYHEQVLSAINANAKAILQFFKDKQLFEIYSDTHGLPGALTALAECFKFNASKVETTPCQFNNPFDKVWWL